VTAAAGGLAAAWRARGSTFSWSPGDGDAPAVDVFHVEAGDPQNPVLLLVHGFPTCSVDFAGVVDLLTDRFRVCALDFPGYGFSDKPRGWGYGLARDAALLDHYLREIVGAESAVLLAHDRGTSVSLRHTLDAAAGRTATRVEHLVLTNGNIFLPLSELTDFQRLVLDPATADDVLAVITPELLAQGMGAATFWPPRTGDDPEIRALADTFAHADGVRVLHETIQYLVERAADEREWLEALARTDVPTTVIWGMNDAVAPPRVAMHVWSEFLMLSPGSNSLYLVPDAGHYVQNDRPDAVVTALLHALDVSADRSPGPLAQVAGAPVLVDCSRPRLPAATEVLAPQPTAGSGTRPG
jgi:pimeloyl-ACP methyl ester carboxylesterase